MRVQRSYGFYRMRDVIFSYMIIFVEIAGVGVTATLASGGANPRGNRCRAPPPCAPSSRRPAAAGFSKVPSMSSEIQRLQTNARMSQVVIANGFVHLAGQVPDSPGASIAVQAGEVLARIDALLAAAGVDKTRVVTANVWLSDAAHFDAFNAVWDAWVPAGHAPTRACVQALLMKPGLDVEIAVTALA